MSKFQKTRAGINLSKMMKANYMQQAEDVKQGKFAVWVGIIVPIEILRGFDIVIGVPENYSAMSSAKGLSREQCEKAEAMGYSMDLCSYARIDIGNNLGPEPDTAIPPLPKPDLLISNNSNCTLLVKWFDVYRHEYNIPHYILDIPFGYEAQKKQDTQYICDQFHDMIATLESMTGQKFNISKVEEAMDNSYEALKHWKRFLRAGESKPAGITAFDSFVQMAPYINMRGTKDLVDHFKILADETEERQRSGIFPMPDESFRLLWDNIAPWHHLRKMSARLAGLKANIVCGTYTNCLGNSEGSADIYPYNGSSPIEFLARIQNFPICAYGLDLRYKVLKELIERYQIDGVVFASNRSCKVYSIMQMDQERKLRDELGIPCVSIDVDHADVRKYNDANAFVRIEALLENIEASRKN